MLRLLRSTDWRPWLFYLALMVTGLGLIARLFLLQVVQGPSYAEDAFENRITRISDPAPRGVIYDRRGVPLVRNVPSFTVTITPARLPDDPDLFDEADPAQTQQIYQRLAQLLNMPIVVPGSTPQAACTPGRGIKDLVDEGAGLAPFVPVKIKCDVPKEVALVIREDLANLRGVGVLVEPLRDYPTGSLTAGLIGYMAPIPAPDEAPLTYQYFTDRGFIPGRDRIGVGGIEASMQDELAGLNGSRLVEEDVAGQELRVISVEREMQPGSNIQLTIDVRLQAAAEGALTQRLTYVNTYLGRAQSDSGVAIAMNPKTGEILAMVSWPTFDNNKFARTIDFPYYKSLIDDPLKPLVNHAVSGIYPPGSVFKIVTATGVLEEGVIDPNRQLQDPGKIVISNKYFPADPGKAKEFVCWNREGHGLVNFVRGIAESCDVYFYKIGGGYEPDRLEGLGIERLAKWMGLFGFGAKTGVELLEETTPAIPSSKWKRINYGENWATGDTYNAAIGQGYVLSTPLQMLNAFNVIANGGTLYRPTLVDKILDGQGNVITDTQPEVIRHLPISAETLRLIHEGMRQAVTIGTLSGNIDVFGETGTPIVDVPNVIVGGKTGTAEYCDELAYPKGLCVPGQWPTHAWTALYAPFDNPEVVVIVFVYNGGEGSKVAAPIASTILRAYFDLKALDAAQPPASP
jgi:penicillin-binding protein 2